MCVLFVFRCDGGYDEVILTRANMGLAAQAAKDKFEIYRETLKAFLSGYREAIDLHEAEERKAQEAAQASSTSSSSQATYKPSESEAMGIGVKQQQQEQQQQKQ
jgi:hypothetical protein